MPARLFCKTGELAGSEFRIGHEAVVGRLSENEVTLHPTIISAKHARIFFDEGAGCYFLEDLGSSNGTALDGVPVHEATRLEALHVVTFAHKFDFIFQAVPGGAARTPAPRPAAADATQLQAPPTQLQQPPEPKTRLGDDFAPVPPLEEPGAPLPQESAQKTRFGDGFLPTPNLEEPDPAPPERKTRVGDAFAPTPPLEEPDPQEPAGARTQFGDAFAPTPPLEAPAGSDEATLLQPAPSATPVLDVTRPDGTVLHFPLAEGEYVLGRSEEADLTVPEGTVSRSHARLAVRGGRVFLRDLGSKNHTYLDQARVQYEVEVRPGARLRFGLDVHATLRIP